MPRVEGKALLEQHNLIYLFSKEWEERCRAATQRYSRLDEKKITEAEKRWRVKQLLKELVFTDTKRQAKPAKGSELV